MTHKTTSTYQFKQSERMDMIKTHDGKLENNWEYMERMLLQELKLMKSGFVGDFEVIIRRKNDE